MRNLRKLQVAILRFAREWQFVCSTESKRPISLRLENTYDLSFLQRNILIFCYQNNFTYKRSQYILEELEVEDMNLKSVEKGASGVIVAVISEKGGTGKTTIAIHLAGWRKSAGADVMLVDGDRQGTATYWVEVRNELELPTPSAVQAFQRSLRRSVMDLTRHYDEIVVDVGAGDGVGMESILRIADLAIVPLQPNELDIWTVGLLDELAGDAGAVNEKLTVQALLNRAPTHHANTDAQAAQAALVQCQYIEATGLTIRERSSIRRSVPAGKLVTEWQPRDPKGEQELGAVYELVYGNAVPGELFGSIAV